MGRRREAQKASQVWKLQSDVNRGINTEALPELETPTKILQAFKVTKELLRNQDWESKTKWAQLKYGIMDECSSFPGLMSAKASPEAPVSPDRCRPVAQPSGVSSMDSNAEI